MLLQVVGTIERLKTKRTWEIVVFVMRSLVSSKMLLSLKLLRTSDIITRKGSTFLYADIVVEDAVPLGIAAFLSSGKAR